MNPETLTDPRRPGRRKGLLITLLAVGVILAVALGGTWLWPDRHEPDAPRFPRRLDSEGGLTVWWDGLPKGTQSRVTASGADSNMRPADYVGPETCKKCHAGNYEAWSHHPHRWMNALATEATVRGDFSGKAAIAYRGGQATFFRQAGQYRMKLERGGIRRTYAITQTIGSRFFQYYVGKQEEGPEPAGHHFYTRDHVLPFGYWLSQHEWVPVVHIGSEVPDEQRPDPYAPPDQGMYYADYAASCNSCHTTFALGDLLSRKVRQVGAHAPEPLHWSLRDYLEETHPEMVPVVAAELGRPGVPANPLSGWEAPRYAVTLGVSCEACHLGGKAHVESGGQVPPKFFPSSPHLFVESKGAALDYGRSHDNVNWACGRCHTGARPQFAAGMSTWNSVEYADAVRGSCYSQLRCISCHNPHRAIGQKWSLTADQDDSLCLKCHKPLLPAKERQAHTHHPAGTEGARCMNCHMPRLNEGLEDVVRTHMIFSPTRADMIEAGQPNACNLCHTDRPMSWTLRYLKDWYGKSYSDVKVTAASPEPARPAAVAWLKSDNPAVRLVAAAALTRARDSRALPSLVNALDDPYLVNRQFAAKGLQEMLGLRLADLGYHFYQTAAERRQSLADVRARLAAPKR
jgi:predicted CXXCH cytochrome family protein